MYTSAYIGIGTHSYVIFAGGNGSVSERGLLRGTAAHLAGKLSSPLSGRGRAGGGGERLWSAESGMREGNS